MPTSRDRSVRAQRTTFGAGLLGGFVGAALLLGVVTIAPRPGPSEAHASPELSVEDRPRGLISAADQRKQIIDRMDRILATLERIEAANREANADRPPSRTR